MIKIPLRTSYYPTPHRIFDSTHVYSCILMHYTHCLLLLMLRTGVWAMIVSQCIVLVNPVSLFSCHLELGRWSQEEALLRRTECP